MVKTQIALRVEADVIERARRLAPSVAAAQSRDQVALHGTPITASAVVRLALRRGLAALEAEHASRQEGNGR